MMVWARTAGQIAVMTAAFAGVAAFADWPHYRQIAPETAVVKLSISHGSSRMAECRKRTVEELAQMPANMRQPLDCPRARGSIYVELDVDGQQIYRATVPPSGIAGDGLARIYHRFAVSAGSHAIAVRMRDTPRTSGFDHRKSADVVLLADQNFVVDFSRAETGFVFR